MDGHLGYIGSGRKHPGEQRVTDRNRSRLEGGIPVIIIDALGELVYTRGSAILPADTVRSL